MVNEEFVWRPVCNRSQGKNRRRNGGASIVSACMRGCNPPTPRARRQHFPTGAGVVGEGQRTISVWWTIATKTRANGQDDNAKRAWIDDDICIEGRTQYRPYARVSRGHNVGRRGRRLYLLLAS